MEEETNDEKASSAEAVAAVPVGHEDDNKWAAGCHLAAFAGFLVPFGGVIGPLVIWLMKKDEISVVYEHGKESLNFQISMLIYMIVSGVLFLVFIGIILLPIVVIANIVLVIIATMKASNGESYEYPVSIRLIK